MKILLIKSDETWARMIQLALESFGYEVVVSPSLQDAASRWNTSFNFFLVELFLANQEGEESSIESGLQAVEQLRAKFQETPILVLSENSQIETKIQAFHNGANDFVPSPCHIDELHARIKSIFEAIGAHELHHIAHCGDLIVDTLERTVLRGRIPIKLTPIAYRLLAFLLNHKCNPMSHEEIVRHVWEKDYDPQSKLLPVAISSLRKSLDEPFAYHLIHTSKSAYMVCDKN